MYRQSLLLRTLFLCSLMVAGNPLGADEDWRLWRESGGVQIYRKTSASGYLEVRAVTEVQSTFSAFIALLHDTARVPDWMGTVSEVTVIKVIDQRSNVVLTRFKTPWPVANRDMVTYSEYHQPSPCSLVLEISDVHDVIPEYDNFVRIIDVETRWALTKLSATSIRIEYQAYANPSGNLPAWIANRATLGETLKSLQALRDVLTEDRYQSQVVDGITECPDVTDPGTGGEQGTTVKGLDSARTS